MLDTIIVGSGPAGLCAAIYAKRANLSVLVIEKEYEGTGQIAYTEQVDNYLGLDGMSGYELGEKFRQHALNHDISFYEGNVIGIEQGINKIWNIVLEDGNCYEAKTVIYCAGAKHRKLLIPGEEKFYGRGVSVCALCDGSFYQGKKVAVIGGGNSALEDAAYLSKICDKVYLIHRRNEFRADNALVDTIFSVSNIEPILSVTPVEITGEDNLSGILLSNGQQLEIQGVFVEIGMEPNTDAIIELGIVDEAGYIETTESGETKRGGFYAAGDVRAKKLRQLVTAVSDGANAAVGAAEYIRAKDIERLT